MNILWKIAIVLLCVSNCLKSLTIMDLGSRIEQLEEQHKWNVIATERKFFEIEHQAD